MGNIVSFDIPSSEELKKVTKSAAISKQDLQMMKDALKKIALAEGGISKEDWVDVCTQVGITDKGFVDDFYAIFDSEGNEWIDFKEFAMYAALVGRDQRSKKVEYCFRVWDRNGSGTLDRSEVELLVLAATRVLKRCNFVLPGLRPVEKIRSFELSSKDEEKVRKAAGRLFDRLDKSGDDEISYREFQKGADRKEIKEVLDYFCALSGALPDKLDYRSSGKGKGKSKGKDQGKSKSKSKSKSKIQEKGSKSKSKGKGKSKGKSSASKAKSKNKSKGKSKK